MNCKMCGGDQLEKIPYRDLAYDSLLLQDLEIIFCNGCGFGSAFPEKSWCVMENFYKTLYRNPKNVAKDRIYINSKNPIKVHPKTLRALAHWLLVKKYCSVGDNANFCDIGSGPGYSFQAAKLLGIKMKMYAFEGDKYSRESLRHMGVNVFNSVFSPSIKLPLEKFKTVFMSHVLEHYTGSEIIPILKNVKQMLGEDGCFLCEVPNNPKDYLNDREINVSPHLTFWTEQSLQRAFELAGFNCLFVSSCGKRLHEVGEENISVELAKRINLKTMIENFLVTYPSLYKSISYLKNFRNKTSIFQMLSNDIFQYGKGRRVLRVVATIR